MFQTAAQLSVRDIHHRKTLAYLLENNSSSPSAPIDKLIMLLTSWNNTQDQAHFEKLITQRAALSLAICDAWDVIKVFWDFINEAKN